MMDATVIAGINRGIFFNWIRGFFLPCSIRDDA